MRNIIYHFVFLFCFLFLSKSFSQSFIIRDVETEVKENKIIIYYGLIGKINDDCEIKLIMKRESDKEFIYTPKLVSGDVGEGNFVGNRRKIVWEFLKEFPMGLEGDDYIFEVQAFSIGGGIPWYYFAGAAVLGGGVAAILSGGKSSGSEQTSVTTISIPAPPRPANK